MTHRRMNHSKGPFLRNYDESELRTAAEFLSNWMPFLSRDLCKSCTRKLSGVIRSLDPESTEDRLDYNGGADLHSCEVITDGNEQLFRTSEAINRTKVSWADMAAEDKNIEEKEEEEDKGVFSNSVNYYEETSGSEVKPKVALSRDQRESIRFSSVIRKKDFVYLERVDGKLVNIVGGLELHKGIFSIAEQKRIVNLVEELQELGKKGQLKDRTYSAPRKWMKGKGRVTLQFGCCYNYAVDKNGNPPGILKDEMVDPLPHLFKVMIRRLIRWHVLPPSCVPDSCIVNIYDEGDCIPPHIDNHEFLRPFCTVSFLSECEILFGTNLKILSPGQFAGSFAIPLPVGVTELT